MGVVKIIAHVWLSRWNESGYEGLVPRFAGGKPSKLTGDQKKKLKASLEAKDLWYLNEIVGLIKTRFGVEYSERQVRRILKGFRMKHAKPYQVDYRKPDDAEEKLKKVGSINSGDLIIGFFDKSAPRTTAKTVRSWSFMKPVIRKNTTKFRANTLDFYAFNDKNFYTNIQTQNRKASWISSGR